jgi:hypothetical protein
MEKRPDVMMLKAQLPPDKYDEAMKQFTGLFVSNVGKLMDNKFMHPATSKSIPKIMDYQGAPDDQKSSMIDTVKTLTINQVEKAYKLNKAGGIQGKATWNADNTRYGLPTIANLSRPSYDDGQVDGKNPKGEPLYKRLSLAESSVIKENLFNMDTQWKDNGYTIGDTQLDHILELEGGGTNTKNNLMLISKVSDQLNQPFEDYIGAKYKAGTISRADAIKASVDYKINKSVTFQEIKNGKY